MNLRPSDISFRDGALLTAALGVLLQPWRLIQSTQGFIYTWLIGYSAILGPIGGVVIADYFFLRKRKLNIDALYSDSPAAAYHYIGGVNPVAIAAFLAGALPSIPGFLAASGVVRSVHPVFSSIYSGAWFFGFGLAAVFYLTLSSSLVATRFAGVAGAIEGKADSDSEERAPVSPGVPVPSSAAGVSATALAAGSAPTVAWV